MKLGKFGEFLENFYMMIRVRIRKIIPIMALAISAIILFFFFKLLFGITGVLLLILSIGIPLMQYVSEYKKGE
jgi:hypothetical protein